MPRYDIRQFLKTVFLFVLPNTDEYKTVEF